MSSVGAYLRGLREQQGMSVDELSRATRVLSHYLEALEADDVRALPAPVFTKGFIRAYCQAVGVPPDEALRLYDRIGVPAPDLSQAPANAVRAHAAPDLPHRHVVHEPPDYLTVTPPGLPPQGEPRDGRSRGTLLISFILLVVLGAAFFAVTLALQSGREAEGEREAHVAIPQPLPSAEAPAPAPAAVPVAAEGPAPPQPAPTQVAKQSPNGAPATAPPAPASAHVPAAPIAPAPPRPQIASSAVTAPPAAAPAPGGTAAGVRGPGAPYRLIARTTETTWMRVRTDDGRTSEETIPANEIREWISNGPFIITIGNAGGVSLELNGRPVPRLGASGSVITRLVLPSENQ